ncbi:30S ribosomal protein S5 [bacterium HR19]|nr:30S ribosomal protein S5 [bacterium HR19]
MGKWGKRGRMYAGNSYIYLQKYIPKEDDEIVERVLETSRVTRVTKGGKRFSFRAFCVVGNMKGAVGYGMGKALEPSEAIRKAVNSAKKKMIVIPIVNGTIPHEVEGKFGTSRVILRPAAPGTGITAGGTVKAIMTVAGIKNILTKSIGGNNPLTLTKAVFDAFSKLRTLSLQAKLRGKKLTELLWEENKAEGTIDNQ